MDRLTAASTDPLVPVLCSKFRKYYKYASAFELEDMVVTAHTAVWLARQENDPNVLRKAIRWFWKLSDWMRNYTNFLDAKRSSPKALTELPNYILPTQNTLTGWNPLEFSDPLEIAEQDHYESNLQLENLLAALIKEWKHPELALAYVLHTAYGLSVPTILDFLQPKEKVSANAVRKRAWEILSRCKEYAEEALRKHHARLVEHFTQGD